MEGNGRGLTLEIFFVETEEEHERPVRETGLRDLELGYAFCMCRPSDAP